MDEADDLVTRDDRHLLGRQLAVDDVKVGATHAARADADRYLTRERDGQLALGRLHDSRAGSHKSHHSHAPMIISARKLRAGCWELTEQDGSKPSLQGAVLTLQGAFGPSL